jgi:integrase
VHIIPRNVASLAYVSKPRKRKVKPFDARRVKAGLHKITVHDVRRTCASLLAALDVHPRVAMGILRHAQIGVTMNVYTEVSDAKTLQALKRLGKQLGP